MRDRGVALLPGDLVWASPWKWPPVAIFGVQYTILLYPSRVGAGTQKQALTCRPAGPYYA